MTRFITAHLDGACRLAADSQMGGAAPAPDGAAAAVEQHHLDVVLLGHGDDALLSLEQRPGGREAAGILAGVGVACTGGVATAVRRVRLSRSIWMCRNKHPG